MTGSGEGTNGPVYALSYNSNNSNIYVGGLFDTVDGSISASNVASWNTNNYTWKPLTGSGEGTNGPVYALSYDVSNDTLFVGGLFDTVDGSISASNIASWKGGWSKLSGGDGQGTDGPVYAITNNTGSQNIYIGGSFTSVNIGGPFIVSASNMAIWNNDKWYGTSSNPVVVGFNDTVKTLSIDINSAKLYAGGSFTYIYNILLTSSNHVAICNAIPEPSITAWLPIPDDTGITPYYSSPGNGVNRQVNAIKHVQNNQNPGIIVAGTHTQAYELQSIIDCSSVSYFIDNGENNNTWIPLTYLNNVKIPDENGFGISPFGVSGPSCIVKAVLYDNTGNIFVAGTFIGAGGLAASNIARYYIPKQQWVALTDQTTGLNGVFGPSSTVNALTYDYNNKFLYVGGVFTSASGSTCKNIAKWDGVNWSEITASGFNGPVYALEWEQINNHLYVGGDFTSVDLISVSNIAYWDVNTLSWSQLSGDSGSGGNGTNAPVYTLKYNSTNNLLYVGGNFTRIQMPETSFTKDAYFIATWDVSNLQWQPVSNGTNGTVYALEKRENDIVVGGAFTVVDYLHLNISAFYMAILTGGTDWNPAGSNDIKGPVRCISYDINNPTLLYFGGEFTKMTMHSSDLFTYVKHIASADPTNSYKFEAIPINPGQNSNGTNDIVYAIDTMRYEETGQPIIIAGGAFTKTYYNSTLPESNIQNANYVAYWDISKSPETGWFNLFSPIPKLSDNVYSVVYKGSDIYVGGNFNNIITTTINHIVRWNIDDELWYPIVSADETGVNDTVNTLAIDTTTLYLGGKFSTGGGKTLNFIGSYTISTAIFNQYMYGIDIGFDDQVLSLYIKSSANTLLIGGQFTKTNGGLLPKIYHTAKASTLYNTISAIRNIDGTHSGVDMAVYAVYNINGYLYFGGDFTVPYPIADETFNYMCYFDASGLNNSINLQTGSSGVFIDSEFIIISTIITVPLRYKFVNLICSDFNNETWIIGYRSTGVTTN